VITAPSGGTLLDAGQPVRVSVAVRDADLVTQVNLLVNGTPVSFCAEAPFQFLVQLPPGEVALEAEAYGPADTCSGQLRKLESPPNTVVRQDTRFPKTPKKQARHGGTDIAYKDRTSWRCLRCHPCAQRRPFARRLRCILPRKE
jgi:hypothetical protein